jgi:AcrR family transcriptional regulator
MWRLPPEHATNWWQYDVTIVSEPSIVRAETNDTERRRYDSPVRRQQAAATRERIVSAGSELVHEFDSWEWDALTFRAVAERAGVGERTVYRHFPTERHLHDAVMARLEEEAGVAYEDLELTTLPEITARVFSSRGSFAAREAVPNDADPLFVEVDQRRRDALLRAVTDATPTWADAERRTIAALLDLVWSMPGYERLVGAWDFDGDDATHAITWLMSLLTDAIDDDRPPPTPRARRGSRGRTIAK